MAGPGIMEMVMVVFQAFAGMSGGQMPIGIPPRAEMPVMSQVAPEECLFYMSFAGVATPEAEATNQTERLMAEPQVQALIKSVDVAIEQATQKGRNAEMSAAGYALVKQALTLPWCVYVTDVKMTDSNGPPQVRGGAMVYLGDQQAAFEKSLQTILKDAHLPPEIPTVMIEGKKFNRLPLGPGATLTWGINDKMLVVGLGDGTVEAMLRRAKTPAPAWLTELKKQLPIERRATTTYVNLAKVREIVVPLVAESARMEEGHINEILQPLGLANLTSIRASSGLDEKGMVELMQVEADGPVTGLLASLVGSPLTADDLSLVPADANIVGAYKIDLVKLYDSIGKVSESVRPGSSQMLEMQSRQIAAASGFKTLKELLGTIGQTWIVYNSPSEGGPLLTGLTLSVEVNDSFVQTKAAFETILSMLNRNDPEAPTLVRTLYKGTQIAYLKCQDGPVPLAPAWCVKDGRLILSLIPQNIRTILNRDAATFKSIAEAPEVAKALAQNAAPTSLFYADPKTIVQVVYPFIPYVAQSVAGMLREKEKIDFDAIDVPGLPVILPYAKPMIRTMRNTGSGIELETRSTLPGITMSSSSMPVIAAFMLPAVHSARGAARRAQSMNHMKQIGLGMVLYENARGYFPAAYTVDKKGKPLLSWRVYILPYIEESALYKRFKLDEPWDSPNNKKLIPLMPQVFKSPKSNAGPGMTNYLTVRTKGSVFPGKEKVRMRDITDGNSNTIMTVEVNDATAVTWTKPDDFVPDKKDPTKGLKGIYSSGVMIVGFCDGSVNALSEEIDKEVLRNLFTKNGREEIDYSEL